MSFEKNGFLIIRNTLHKEICSFLTCYMKTKEQAARFLLDVGMLEEFGDEWGRWDDQQVDGAYSIYSDMAMESVLQVCQPVIEKYIDKKLSPNYSYTRVYSFGDELVRHVDRPSCEISATINLGGDLWPIYLNNGSKDFEVLLNPGDALVYKGDKIPHWRNKFTGQLCYQVFVHYNSLSSEGNLLSAPYDGRPALGVPPVFRDKGGVR